MKLKSVVAIGSLALALSLSACGEDSTDASASGPDTSEELTSVTISLLPIMDVLPVHLAIQEGIFEKHGLDLEPVPAQSGSGLVPSVLEGSVDIAFGNAMTYLLAVEKDIPLDVVFLGGAEERPEGEPGGEHTASVLIVNEDSPIDSAADLEGKVVSVNGVGNIQEVAVKNAVDIAGGDADQVQLLELPLSQAQSALESGRIDAASVNVPFSTIMIDDGMRVIADTLLAIDGSNVNHELYFTSREFSEANPEVLESFRAAMDEAIDLINDDVVLARETLGSYSEIDPEVLEQLPIHIFHKDISPDAIDSLVNAAKKHGVLDDSDKVTADKVVENVPTIGEE